MKLQTPTAQEARDLLQAIQLIRMRAITNIAALRTWPVASHSAFNRLSGAVEHMQQANEDLKVLGELYAQFLPDHQA